MTSKPISVLMFFPCIGNHSQDAFAGVQGAAAARHWELFSADTVRAENGTVQLHRSSRAAGSVSELVGLLHPDGIIVWQDALSRAELRTAAGRGVPTVFVDCGAMGETGKEDWAGRVRGDPKSIATLAARVLLASRYDNYAFVPNSVPLSWSTERGEAFRHCIEVAGKRFFRFDRSAGAEAAPPDAGSLGRWLKTLPKPCGIFAANDGTAEEVLGACAQLGLAVPDDIAVVGVDDYAYFCESTTPTLSSIAMDLRAEGRAAVAMLEGMMAEPGRRQPTRFVPARDAVPRASTRFARDRRVAQALEFIRLHACTEKFGPRVVVREMGVSRALADRLFRAVVGHTILDEIHAVRLARAKELLAAGTQPDIVAGECGYASYDDFRRVFRRRVGTTARQWALAHFAS